MGRIAYTIFNLFGSLSRVATAYSTDIAPILTPTIKNANNVAIGFRANHVAMFHYGVAIILCIA